MADTFRITRQTVSVLAALISAKEAVSGADIARITSLPSGTLYPILVRLEKHKWVESEWENEKAEALGRPRRRLYSITALGARKTRAEFAEIGSIIRRPVWGIS